MILFGEHIHLQRFFRSIYCFLFNLPFILKCRLHGVRFIVGRNSYLKGCSVEAKRKNGQLIIGDDCLIKNTVFSYYGIGGMIIIKDRVTVNARPEAITKLCVKDESRIEIDEECLLSNAIDIATTDWHSVINERGERINYEKDVFIGRHVWIGRKVLIGKGVSIPNNSIIGAGSVVTKQFTDSNVVIAGNPAIIRKDHVSWK